ncbi:MAG: sulfite exporter TauE/SafE family protein [Dehalococcoidia bacterium]
MPDFLVWPGLILLGVVVGAYGTMIGAGGGFVLVPLLLLLYPSDPPELVTAMSIGVVFFNALSGTFAYIRQRRIDFVGANAFALATIPGAIVGSLVTSYVPRNLFNVIFALVLLCAAAVLILRPEPRVVGRTNRRGEIMRMITDRRGDTFAFSYNLWYGIVISIFIGFLASLLGIGGGLIHVPVMIQVLHYPAHIATGTSHYVLTVTAGTSAMVHLLAGDYEGGYMRTAALAVGVIAGAQVGAIISARLHGAIIVRFMAIALLALGARLLITTLY